MALKQGGVQAAYRGFDWRKRMKNKVSAGQEVDIKELLYGVMKAWRPVLGLGLGCAVLLGGYKASQSLAGQMDAEYASDQQEQYEADLLVYESARESYEREIENMVNSLDSQQEYLQNSVLMQISPYEKGTAAADLYVKTDYQIMPGMDYQNQDYTDALVKAYGTSLKEDGVLEAVAEQMGLELRYLKELISVTPDLESDVLTVTVAHTDEAAAGRLLDLLLEGLEEKEEELSESVGAHDLVVLSQTTDSVVDLSLSDSQKRVADSLTTLQDSLEEKEKALSQLSKPSLSPGSRRAVLSVGVKYGVLGGVMGVLLGAFCACLFWLFRDKAEDGGELELRFGFPELGTFGSRKKRWFSCVDRLVDRMFGKKPAADDETVYRRIEARIRYYYPEAKQLYLGQLSRSGNAGGPAEKFAGELAKEFAGRLKEAFPERTLQWGGALAEDPEALGHAASSDGVILVVEKGRTAYQEIQREAEAAKSCGARILGFVLS